MKRITDGILHRHILPLSPRALLFCALERSGILNELLPRVFVTHNQRLFCQVTEEQSRAVLGTSRSYQLPHLSVTCLHFIPNIYQFYFCSINTFQIDKWWEYIKIHTILPLNHTTAALKDLVFSSVKLTLSRVRHSDFNPIYGCIFIPFFSAPLRNNRTWIKKHWINKNSEPKFPCKRQLHPLKI